MINYEKFFSLNAKGMKKSEIRELLKLTNKPGIISFAGGLPAPDLFPVEEIKELAQYVLEKEGGKALQYGQTEGVYSLREQLLKLLNEDGINIPIEQLIVTTSSQQGLDLIGKIFVDPGDIIMTGNPTYLGAIQAFNAYGAKMKGVELDDNGMNTEILDREIKKSIDIGKKPKFIYVIPDFQNPSGITMNLERRKKIIEVAEKYDLIILEDSPYRQLRFEGKAEPPLISLNSERVISIYTFSKILLPGFRLGWMAGPDKLIQKVIIAKQATDLCSPPFNQYVLAEFMKRGLLKKQISKIISAYREKKDFMIDKLQQYMPKLEGLTWTSPEGGLFLWVTLPKYIDITEMFEQAVNKNVAYVVGTAFYPNEGGNNSCRLNFSYASMEQIDEGIKRFGELVREWNK
jgi:2-aminoadipate transaminase